jgi:hypothetical protein
MRSLVAFLLLLAGGASILCAQEQSPRRDEKPLAERKRGLAQPPTLKRLTASVQTPLFVGTPDGAHTVANVIVTGKATAMERDAPGEVVFAPPLSGAGRAVLQSVSEYLLEIYRGWPAGHRIEFTFSAAVAPDDTAAAGLAVATLLDSMLGGWEAEPTTAVIGHLHADGRVQRVTSPMARITAATRGGASRILLAETNSADAADCLVNEGIAGFSRVQILAVKDFEELRMMAAKKLDADVAAAFHRFGDAQRMFGATSRSEEDTLARPDLQDALRGTLAKWPNHVTARLLLGRTMGRYRTFTVAGSVEAVERIAPALLKAIDSSEAHDPVRLSREQIAAELMTLRRAEERLDTTARPFLAQLIAYGEAAATWHARGKERTVEETRALSATLVKAAARARQERQKLAATLAR